MPLIYFRSRLLVLSDCVRVEKSTDGPQWRISRNGQWAIHFTLTFVSDPKDLRQAVISTLLADLFQGISEFLSINDLALT